MLPKHRKIWNSFKHLCEKNNILSLFEENDFNEIVCEFAYKILYENKDINILFNEFLESLKLEKPELDIKQILKEEEEFKIAESKSEDLENINSNIELLDEVPKKKTRGNPHWNKKNA